MTFIFWAFFTLTVIAIGDADWEFRHGPLRFAFWPCVRVFVFGMVAARAAAMNGWI